MPTQREIIKKIKKVRIKTQRLVDTLLAGEYASAFQGHGLEFSEVRPYAEGDDVRLIDWNVSARMNEPFVKQYIEERELKIYILVDISPSHNFGTEGSLKKELMVEFAATIAWLGISRNDKVGLTLVTDKVEKSLPPKKGKRQLARIIESLIYHEPTSMKTSLESGIAYLGKVAKRRGVVFIISDFLTDENLTRPLKVLAIKHDVIMVRLADRWERELPVVGLIEIEDPETGETMVLDTNNVKVRDAYKKARAEMDEKLNRARNMAGVDLVELSTGQSFLKPLHLFLKRKRTTRVRNTG